MAQHTENPTPAEALAEIRCRQTSQASLATAARHALEMGARLLAQLAGGVEGRDSIHLENSAQAVRGIADGRRLVLLANGKGQEPDESTEGREDDGET